MNYSSKNPGKWCLKLIDQKLLTQNTEFMIEEEVSFWKYTSNMLNSNDWKQESASI